MTVKSRIKAIKISNMLKKHKDLAQIIKIDFVDKEKNEKNLKKVLKR